MRSKRLAVEFAKISEFARDRSLLTSYLVGQTLVITIISFVGVFVSNLSFGVSSVLLSIGENVFYNSDWTSTIDTAGILFNILTVGIALPIGLRALRVRSHVNNFDRYEQLVNAQLAEIGASPVRPQRTRDLEVGLDGDSEV